MYLLHSFLLNQCTDLFHLLLFSRFVENYFTEAGLAPFISSNGPLFLLLIPSKYCSFLKLVSILYLPLTVAWRLLGRCGILYKVLRTRPTPYTYVPIGRYILHIPKLLTQDTSTLFVKILSLQMKKYSIVQLYHIQTF